VPLEYRIDRERRIVFATASARLSDEEVFAYQREVWAGGELSGHDEVVDLSQVEDLVVSSKDRIRELAELASAQDVSGMKSRLAIVAPRDLTYGFARMFETYRGMGQGGQKTVSVFRSMGEALAWLGVPAADRAGSRS
jgi:hypothetical protein